MLYVDHISGIEEAAKRLRDYSLRASYRLYSPSHKMGSRKRHEVERSNRNRYIAFFTDLVNLDNELDLEAKATIAGSRVKTPPRYRWPRDDEIKKGRRYLRRELRKKARRVKSPLDDFLG